MNRTELAVPKIHRYRSFEILQFAREAPEHLRELAGLELKRRQLIRELIAVHVQTEHLKQEMESGKELTTASKH
jgi:hypothetical protein